MTRKEQVKILDDKIESNTNQYKVDRLNAEISAFSSGDLNKYEFLTRKDLKYKPNASDKTKFEFSPLGKAFSTGLDKTGEGYQEEGVIKILKDIRDGLANGVIRPKNMPNRPNDDDDYGDDDDDDDDDDEDDDDDDDDDRPDRPDGALGSVFLNNLNNLNTNLNNIQSNGEHYARLIENQNAINKKLEEEIKNKKKLTKNIIDQAGETINSIKEENSECYNKYKQTLFKYTEALKQLDSANNTYGKEIGTLSTDLNNEKTRAHELINKIQDLEKTNELSANILVDLAKELNELKNNKNKLKEDNEFLDNLVNSLRDNNSKLIQNIKNINNEATRDQAKIRDMLNKVNDNINNLYKQIIDKENDFDAKLNKLNKLNDNIKKINNYIKKDNEKINIEDLEDIDNRCNNLINEYDILRDIMHEYKNEIKKIKKNTNKTKDDFDKIKALEKKLSLQGDVINDSEYFLE